MSGFCIQGAKTKRKKTKKKQETKVNSLDTGFCCFLFSWFSCRRRELTNFWKHQVSSSLVIQFLVPTGRGCAYAVLQLRQGGLTETPSLPCLFAMLFELLGSNAFGADAFLGIQDVACCYSNSGKTRQQRVRCFYWGILDAGSKRDAQFPT